STITLFFLFFAAHSNYTYAQQKLYIQYGKEDYALGKYMAVLEDIDNSITINEAASDSMKNKYVWHDRETLNLKLTRSVFWVRLIVVDTLSYPDLSLMLLKGSRTWLLVKNDPLTEDIRVFYKDTPIWGNKYIEKRSGTAIPVNDKSIKTNEFIAAFQSHKNVPDTIYIRFKTTTQSILSFNMLTPADYTIYRSKKLFFHGILFGIFFLLIVYNLLLYFSVKDKTYLFYTLYIFSYAVFIFIYEGYYFETIGLKFYRDYMILPMSVLTITGIFWLLLTREFLSTKTNLPWAYKLLTLLTFIGPINFVLGFGFRQQWIGFLWSICNLGYYLIGFVIAGITLKKGVYVSRYYIIALTGMVIGISVMVATRHNVLPLPLNFWTQNALNMGILWEALVLAATVGYRFSYLKAEKELEKSLIRNQIASDLHDEIGSNLSTITLQSRLMMKTQHLESNSIEHLQNIIDNASGTAEMIRDIVWFINPLHDNSENLLLRMKELASKMLINFNYTFTINGGDERIFDLLPDLQKRRHLYLIFKETLNNIIKHSGATRVNILFSIKNNKIFMTIKDNGKGFSEDDIVRGEGLNNLRNRASQIDSEIFIESCAGEGTKIILEVRLQK
ncbi:MAG: hypothetical protein K8H86_15880, partial [Ignavibacteriaceae bacterium]|nr:hypothetical protein [Ignavibacteriaceae bacterium]